jgi:hypothetical protein
VPPVQRRHHRRHHLHNDICKYKEYTITPYNSVHNALTQIIQIIEIGQVIKIVIVTVIVIRFFCDRILEFSF